MTARKLTIAYNQYAVEVYDEQGEFMGAITRARMDSAGGSYLIADALGNILKTLGAEVTYDEDKEVKL